MKFTLVVHFSAAIPDIVGPWLAVRVCIYNNNNNTFVERRSAVASEAHDGTCKLAICSVEQVSF